MKGSDVFPSKYIKASDLQGRRVKVQMAFVQQEEMGDDRKPVVYFAGKEKGLVLNVTRWNCIADLYGDESDDWTGKFVVLAPGKTNYQGKRVDCIDVYPPDQAMQPAPAPRQDPQAPIPNVKAELNDEIPF